MKTAISFRNVVKALHGTACLCIDDLHIYEKEAVAFYGLGPDLSEILMQQVTGVCYPEEGKIYFYGADSSELSDASWFDFVRNFGVYNSDSALQENASIGENIATLYRSQTSWMREPQLSSHVLKVANLVQLRITDLAQRMSECDPFLQMKTRLARTLAFKPKVVIIREPTEGVPVELTKDFLELIRRTKRKLKYTLILFTSDMRFLQAVADRVLFLNPISGVVVENHLRGWYHNVLPFLQPSPAKLLQLARDILQYSGNRTTRV